MRSFSETLTMTLPAPDTWNILRPQIEFLSKPFPSAAVEFACSHREEVAPHLIEALTQMVSAPALADDDNYLLHLYALYLLSAWRDSRSYAPMLALGYLSEDKLDMVLGDLLTDGYLLKFAGYISFVKDLCMMRQKLPCMDSEVESFP